jgi:hypothetical protein
VRLLSVALVTNGRVKQAKTELSRRAVPLQAIALEALEQLRPLQDSLLAE